MSPDRAGAAARRGDQDDTLVEELHVARRLLERQGGRMHAGVDGGGRSGVAFTLPRANAPR